MTLATLSRSAPSSARPRGDVDLRHRTTEERLTRIAQRLARQNEALEDFAALVAHELKTPLYAAVVADDPSPHLEDALELIDALLQAAQNVPTERTFASVSDCLDQAVEDLRADVAVSADMATPLPLPPEALRVILRNLLANAIAAGAQRVHVTTDRSSRSFRLLVDDDGTGLDYATGSGLGLRLCGRIAGRFGGRLRVSPRPAGGARATLEFAADPE